jgi:NADPH-dependent 2,4-dienoyl-CoA reductase/sulfur reductase-like enzyme
MQRADVVVIGGSAAGIAAAVTCRRHYPGKSVLLIRKEKQVLIPCGIPYIFGTVGSPEKNLIPNAILEKNEIELLLAEVDQIDRQNRVITTSEGPKVRYGKLVLGTGSRPLIPSIPGVDLENVFVVNKDVDYLQRMLDQVNTSSNLVIVGGGYIGTEFADECRKNRELKITIVEMLPRLLMMTMDEELCATAEGIEKEHGIEVLANEKAEEFIGNGKVQSVKLGDGRELPADMVIIGIGSLANTRLAENAGLKLGPTGGVQVNRYMQTSDEHIYASGDCAEKFSFFDGAPSGLKLASTATKEGRIAGANLFGTRRMNEGVVGVYSTVLDETAFATAGLTESEASRKGYVTVSGVSEAPNRHPGTMPGMANLMVKLTFEKGTGIILGGQAMGAKSAGELINAISMCITQRMTADEIAISPVGTHPALTSSPLIYQLSNAAELAIKEMRA